MKDTIILHHTGDSSPDPQYAKVVAYHNSGAGGKFPKGRGMQYHWFIGKDGTVKEGAKEGSTAYHAGNYPVNLRSIGVCLAGNFLTEKPTQKQIEALAFLLTGIQERYGIPDEKVLLHKQVRLGGTSCPGTDLRTLYIAERAKTLVWRTERIKLAVEKTGFGKRALSRLLDRLEKSAKTEECCS